MRTSLATVHGRHLFLFGLPGVGKSFVGEVLRREFGFHFFDCDDLIEPADRECLGQGIRLTDARREVLLEQIIRVGQELARQHLNVALAQTLRHERHRAAFLKSLPDFEFVEVCASEQTRLRRIEARSHFVHPALAARLASGFDEPRIPHAVLVNDDDSDVAAQLRLLELAAHQVAGELVTVS